MILSTPSGTVALGPLATSALRRITLNQQAGRTSYATAYHSAALSALYEAGLVGRGASGRLVLATMTADDMLAALAAAEERPPCVDCGHGWSEHEARCLRRGCRCTEPHPDLCARCLAKDHQGCTGAPCPCTSGPWHLAFHGDDPGLDDLMDQPDPEPRQECTGIAARWCPNHGECTCPDRNDPGATLEHPGCPLHGDESGHPWPEPSSRWWAISEHALTAALHQAHAGTDPGVVLLELLANSTTTEVP